jgi:hypothetical protein
MERIVGTTTRFEARERAVENGSTPSKRIAVQKNLEEGESPSGVNGRIRSTETEESLERLMKKVGGGALTSQKKGC